jgi:hypothetical protein
VAAKEFTWQPDRMMVDFDAQVQPDAPTSMVVLKFDVSIDEIVVATLRCDIKIKATVRRRSNQSVYGKAARTAFASYSSEDRPRVLDRVAAVKISAGLDDAMQIHPLENGIPPPEKLKSLHFGDVHMLVREPAATLFPRAHSAIANRVGIYAAG